MLTGTQIYTTNFSRPRARENGDRAAQMLVDGNMVTTATKGTLVTQMFVPNVKTSVQPPPPSRVERTLQVLLRSLKRKIAIEFGGIPHPTPADTAKINLWDYEITLILASGEEIDDSFSLVGDGIAKETDLFMARVGKDGNIYFDVTRDDFSELLQFVEFKIRIKKGDRVKENSQAVFRNPRYDIPHEPEPFVSPPF